MTNEMIRRTAEELVRRFQTRDPFKICEGLGISILPLTGARRLKGMYRIIMHNRYLFLSDGLDEYARRIVCAHELGHDRLHADEASDAPLREFTVGVSASRKEYEANLFAAELLLPDSELLPLVLEGVSLVEIAGRLAVDENLVAMKLEAMRPHMPQWRRMDYDSRFLR